MPRVILAPIFAMWFGLGIWSKVALAVTLVFFIVFFNVYQGVREVSPVLLANARMHGKVEVQALLARGSLEQEALVEEMGEGLFNALAGGRVDAAGEQRRHFHRFGLEPLTEARALRLADLLRIDRARGAGAGFVDQPGQQGVRRGQLQREHR